MADLDEFAAACRDRQERTGKGRRHYEAALSNTRRVLFHLRILADAAAQRGRARFADRLAGVTPPIRGGDGRLPGTQDARPARPKTVSSLATRLTHFGAFLAAGRPALASLADLDRRRHIEPYLSALVEAVNTQERRA